MKTYALGRTARTPLVTSLGPLEHACTGRRRSPHSRTWRALCGAGVYPRTVDFDPASPRACRACRKALKALEALDA